MLPNVGAGSFELVAPCIRATILYFISMKSKGWAETLQLKVTYLHPIVRHRDRVVVSGCSAFRRDSICSINMRENVIGIGQVFRRALLSALLVDLEWVMNNKKVTDYCRERHYETNSDFFQRIMNHKMVTI